jgi:AcrR family transcriptional regulator
MSDVKRRYSSPHRERQAALTRRSILDAARQLFVTDGYGSTSMKRVADRAGVAVQTVYATFGNKKELLSQLLDVAIAGDDEPVAVNDRDWMHVVFNDPDPATRLRAYATAVAGIHQRAGDVFAVIHAAADTDPDVVDLADTTEQRRRTGAAAVIAGLKAIDGLAPGLRAGEATDVLWTLNSPDIYRRLVRDCGWSIASYEQWIGSTMITALLRT